MGAHFISAGVVRRSSIMGFPLPEVRSGRTARRRMWRPRREFPTLRRIRERCAQVEEAVALARTDETALRVVVVFLACVIVFGTPACLEVADRDRHLREGRERE